MLHFDGHITPAADPEILKALGSSIAPYDTPFGPRQKGQEKVEALYELFGADPKDQIYICASAQQALDKLVHHLYFDYMIKTGRNHVVLLNTTEALSVNSVDALKQAGVSVKMLSVNNQGQVDLDALKKALTPKVAFLSMSFVTPLTGVVQPIWDIATICRDKGVFLHVDIGPAMGHLYFQFKDLPIDYLTFDGRYLGAPYGGGFLAKKGSYGPKAQSNVCPYMLEALYLGAKKRLSDAEECFEHYRLADHFVQKVRDTIQGSVPYFTNCETLPHVVTIGFPGLHGEALLYRLNQKGVRASIGGQSQQRLERLLGLMGIDEMMARSALSFAIPKNLSQKTLDEAVNLIANQVNQLRKLSGVMAS